MSSIVASSLFASFAPFRGRDVPVPLDGTRPLYAGGGTQPVNPRARRAGNVVPDLLAAHLRLHPAADHRLGPAHHADDHKGGHVDIHPALKPLSISTFDCSDDATEAPRSRELRGS